MPFSLAVIKISSLFFFFFKLNLMYFLKGGVSSSQDAGWKVTSEHVSILKKTLVQVFNEKFSNQLVSTAQVNCILIYISNFNI